MADLLQTARLFEVGTRLQTASTNLTSVAQGNQPDASALKWAGEFLLRVDWTSGVGSDNGIDGGLAVPAASTRPKFYASLVRIEHEFRAVGINTEDEVCDFLKVVYAFLGSGGSDKRKSLTPERLSLAGKFLHILSESIFVDLSDNGLPKREPVLTLGEFVA